MLLLANKLLINNQKNIKEYLPLRRNNFFKTKTLQIDDQRDTKLILVNTIADLTKKLASNNYKTSRIRIHIIYQNTNISNLKFCVDLSTPTNRYTKLLKSILPIFIDNVNQKEQIKKIGISFEKLI